MWFIQLMMMVQSNFQVIGSGKLVVSKNGGITKLFEEMASVT